MNPLTHRLVEPKPVHMKKVLLLFLCLSFGLTHAQFFRGNVGRGYGPSHEVKFNIGQFLVTTTVEGGYEYFLSDDTSIGGSIYFDNDATDYNGDFGIGPQFRAYFGRDPRSGFFAEAFGMYYTGIDEDILAVDQNYSTFALGLGMGSKWVTTSSEKFSLEAYAGFGRNVNAEPGQDTFLYRAGLSIGFRF